MKTLVFGGAGMLGRDLAALSNSEHQVIALTRKEADITNRESVSEAFDRYQPNSVIIAAAWTDVDGAETHQDECRCVNVLGPKIVGEASLEKNIHVVFISSDYVFSKEGPEPHGEEDPHQPLSVYGQSKSEGEQALLETGARTSIVRTSWLFGVHGKNFCATMLKLAQKNDILRVVDDQVGAPTWTFHLAQGLLQVAEKKLQGNFHLTASGQTSWCGLAQEVLSLAGSSTSVEPVTTAEFPRPAPRPHWSVLSNEKLESLGINLPSWQEGVRGWYRAQVGLTA